MEYILWYCAPFYGLIFILHAWKQISDDSYYFCWSILTPMIHIIVASMKHTRIIISYLLIKH